MPRVLIISPYFPPMNAADMHRVRQSLPYFEELGWTSITLAVDPRVVEGPRDDALLETIPPGADVRHVSALDYRWTRKLGLGSLALRALWSYRREGNRLLARGDIDLVYFSTTMFPVMVLGAYWKRRFGVPFVIDMQDPWHTEHYTTRPKHERPAKYWFSYRLNRTLEPMAMRAVDGVICVSETYSATLRDRYPRLRSVPCAVIPFAGAEQDFVVAERLRPRNPVFERDGRTRHVVYVGRGGHDMRVAADAVCGALAAGLIERPELFESVRVHFVGTHYARSDDAAKTLEPVAAPYGLNGRVREHPARVPYFTALQLLRDADMLVLLGSTSAGYTASKLYPYILARRPLLAVFDASSSVVSVLGDTGAGDAVTFMAGAEPGDADLRQRVLACWTRMLERLPFAPPTDWAAFERYTARTMARREADVFDQVLAASRVSCGNGNAP